MKDYGTKNKNGCFLVISIFSFEYLSKKHIEFVESKWDQSKTFSPICTKMKEQINLFWNIYRKKKWESTLLNCVEL